MNYRHVLAVLALAVALSGCASVSSNYQSDVRYEDGSYYSPAEAGYGDYYYAPEPRYDNYYGDSFFYGSPFYSYAGCPSRYGYCPSLWYDPFYSFGFSGWYGWGPYGYWSPYTGHRHHHRHGSEQDESADLIDATSEADADADADAIGDTSAAQRRRGSFRGLPPAIDGAPRPRYPASQLPARRAQAEPTRREAPAPESRSRQRESSSSSDDGSSSRTRSSRRNDDRS